MSSSTIGSVIAASATANAKVFVIGVVGFVSTKIPREAPLIPPEFVDTLARVNFYLFMIPLVYNSLASSITIEELKTLWIAPLSAIVIISLSYLIATILGYLPCFRLYQDSHSFNVLRVATSFPNIVALPILIFPCICEYPIAYEAFGKNKNDMMMNDGTAIMSSSDMYENCVAKSTSMIFLYFFGYNISFWIFGAPKLMQSHKHQKKMNHQDMDETSPDESDLEQKNIHNNNNNNNNNKDDDTIMKKLQQCWVGMKQAITSPGFIAMILGTLTAFIPPLQRALFQQGGSLRFLGGALEGLGQSASIVGIIVVATSLIVESEQTIQANSNDCDDDMTPINNNDDPSSTITNKTYNMVTTSPTDNEERIHHHEKITEKTTLHKIQNQTHTCIDVQQEVTNNFVNDESIVTTAMHDTKDVCSDKHKSHTFFRQIIKSFKFVVQCIIKRKDYMKLSMWYIITRLIVTPAITCAIIIGLDCGGVISNVPNLFKLVIIVNSSLPVREREKNLH